MYVCITMIALPYTENVYYTQTHARLHACTTHSSAYNATENYYQHLVILPNNLTIFSLRKKPEGCNFSKCAASNEKHQHCLMLIHHGTLCERNTNKREEVMRQTRFANRYIHISTIRLLSKYSNSTLKQFISPPPLPSFEFHNALLHSCVMTHSVSSSTA